MEIFSLVEELSRLVAQPSRQARALNKQISLPSAYMEN